ncbi:MAG TPA: sulfite oxidase [Acidimicrobiales bacterium]|nr:sulfite oxidase [Acidimicrobiales bacterium]
MPSDQVTPEELQLATRNHGMPLEVLRHALTPIGLHYLLVHYDIPVIEADSWTLEVGGRVDRPLSLSLADLHRRPQRTVVATMECAGNGRAGLSPRALSQPWLLEAVGTGAWTGTPLGPLLAEAGVARDAVEVVFRGQDRGIEGGLEQNFERSLPLEEGLREDVILAYELNGQPLPPQHGFPLRLLVPGWYGMTNVKWLTAITVVGEPFTGFQQARGYRLRREDDEQGAPLSRMLPRALMVPPGIPECFSRRRTVRLGPCSLEGRAWSGHAPVTAVDVSTDGGKSWSAAELDQPPPSPWAWRGWRCLWQPRQAGDYELCCRARDAAGNQQPLSAPWNLGGYANNSVQRVAVTVQDAAPD